MEKNLHHLNIYINLNACTSDAKRFYQLISYISRVELTLINPQNINFELNFINLSLNII